jgi:hypothetical protein
MTTNTATAKTTDKKAAMRDKRAQSIAAMGLVSREGERFKVATPTMRGRQASYEVWRDAHNRVRCSCLEFTEFAAEDTAFRCEHILAVKHALLAKGTEAQPALPATAPVPASAGASPTHNANASEEQPAEVVSEREPADAGEEVSNVRSLAEHINQKELNEMKLQDPFALEAEDNEILGETPNNVIPMNFVATLRNLRSQVDARVVKTREGWTDRNGQQHYVEYVEWHAVADILDKVAPTWSHSVRNINLIGDIVAVTAAITIDGVTREGIGTGYADSEVGIKKAEHDALKRAAVKFGIARELYQKESETIEREGGAPPNRPFSGSPQARSLNDLVTAKQLGMIRALAREANTDAEAECQSLFKCQMDELSKRAASSFIDHLKAQAQETVAGELRRAS